MATKGWTQVSNPGGQASASTCPRGHCIEPLCSSVPSCSHGWGRVAEFKFRGPGRQIPTLSLLSYTALVAVTVTAQGPVFSTHAVKTATAPDLELQNLNFS